ncbi:hypothetical protein BH11PSE14_BH11PSE14_21560 [soil metagenome]
MFVRSVEFGGSDKPALTLLLFGHFPDAVSGRAPGFFRHG